MDSWLEIISQYPRSLLACLLIGFSNGFVSAFVVLRRQALEVGTLPHALLPGLAIAAIISGGALTQFNALLGGVIAALLVGLGSLFVARSSRIDQHTALGILYTTAFSVGMILLSRLHMRQKLEDWLFGSIMGMTDADLWITFGISAVALLLMTALQRPLLILMFDPPVAASLGVPVRALNYLLFGIVILVLVSSVQTVGCILSVGLMIAPAATIYMFSNDARKLFWGGGLIGAVSSVFAFFLSYWLSWHPSSTIVLVLGALFILACLFSPRYGLLRRKSAVPSPVA